MQLNSAAILITRSIIIIIIIIDTDGEIECMHIRFNRNKEKTSAFTHPKLTRFSSVQGYMHIAHNNSNKNEKAIVLNGRIVLFSRFLFARGIIKRKWQNENEKRVWSIKIELDKRIG